MTEERKVFLKTSGILDDANECHEVKEWLVHLENSLRDVDNFIDRRRYKSVYSNFLIQYFSRSLFSQYLFITLQTN